MYICVPGYSVLECVMFTHLCIDLIYKYSQIDGQVWQLNWSILRGYIFILTNGLLCLIVLHNIYLIFEEHIFLKTILSIVQLHMVKVFQRCFQKYCAWLIFLYLSSMCRKQQLAAAFDVVVYHIIYLDKRNPNPKLLFKRIACIHSLSHISIVKNFFICLTYNYY